jgi:hypothetical protein
LSKIQKSLESSYQPEDLALFEMDEFICSEQHDYCTYLTANNKVLSNATKVLILSTFLFKLLSQYKMPETKHVTGAETDFKN